MATMENREVYEYCDNLFRAMGKADGGYYPQKHDTTAFEQTAAHFNISIDEVDKIYGSYSKLAAEIERRKINRLPQAKRKAASMRKLRDIMLNNRDLPFHKIEGEPSEPISSAGDVIENEYKTMVETIAKDGWTIPLTIDIKRFQELEQCASSTEQIDEFFTGFYKKSEFNAMCRRIGKTITNPGQKQRFEECVTMYASGLFSSCLTVLTTILEGYISSFGDDPKDVRVMRICDFHAKEESAQGNKIKSLCWSSMHEYTQSLFEKSDFSQEEPNKANRHWMIHGRTSQLGEGVDCLRLFNAISTMTIIKGKLDL